VTAAPLEPDTAARDWQVEVAAFEMTAARADELFTAIADLAHDRDEQVTCSFGPYSDVPTDAARDALESRRHLWERTASNAPRDSIEQEIARTVASELAAVMAELGLREEA
jgi:hypothetical protein